jgi:hypothetical protein
MMAAAALLHLGRDLQDDQHAERRHRRGLQGAYMLSWKLALKANALPRRLQAVAAAELGADLGR